MKILLLTSEFAPRLGGIGTYARELAHAASELGHQITLVAADYGADQTASDRALSFETLRYPGGDHSMRHLPGKIALLRKLARQRPQFDIVHALDWPFYLPLALSAYRHRSRCIVTFHGSEIAFMQHRHRAAALHLARFWTGWAEFVANSRDTAARLATAFGPDPAQIRVTGLGVSQFWRDGPQPVTRDPTRFVIATLGRVVPRKGHLLLAQALALLPPAMQAQIDWHIIGPLLDPAYEAKLREAIASLAVNTLITGPLPATEIRTRLASADLFCLPGMPSEDGAVEGYGLVYLEAAACGLPSLATKLGGIEDAILDSQTGLLVPPANPAALAAAILRLYRDPTERNRLARNARSHADKSGWRDVARRTYEAAPR